MAGTESLMQPRMGVPSDNRERRVVVMELPRCPSCSCTMLAKVFAYVALVALVVTGFVLQLVGSILAHRRCSFFSPFYGNAYESFYAYGRYHSVYLYYDYNDVRDHCTDTFRSYYWTSSFQLAICVVITIFWLCGFLRKFRAPLLTLLGLATVLLIQRTESSLNGIHNGGFHNFARGKHAKIAAIGYIISAAVNFILLFVVGTKQYSSWRSGLPVHFSSHQIPSGSGPVVGEQPVPQSQVMAKEYVEPPRIV